MPLPTAKIDFFFQSDIIFTIIMNLKEVVTTAKAKAKTIGIVGPTSLLTTGCEAKLNTISSSDLIWIAVYGLVSIFIIGQSHAISSQPKKKDDDPGSYNPNTGKYDGGWQSLHEQMKAQTDYARGFTDTIPW